MANEIVVRMGLSYSKGNVRYSRGDVTYKDDVVATYPAGPYVGTVLVTTEGSDVDFSAADDVGWVRLTNQENDGGSDADAGVYDPETGRYYPLIKLKPGKMQQILLDDLFGWSDYPTTVLGTGTGTATQRVRLRIRAKAHSCRILVEAFER